MSDKLTKKEAEELQEENASIRSRIAAYGRRALAKKNVGVDMACQLAGAGAGGAAAGVADHYDSEGAALLGIGATLALGAALRIKDPNDIAGKLSFSTGCGGVGYMAGKEAKAYLDEDAPAE